MGEVELGFAKKTESCQLLSHCFRSKVGGKPPWLALSNLPDPSELLCRKCNNPYVFLLQVYAPLNESADTFHRSIFIFMCSNGKCNQRFSSENFVVYRCQLPRENQFYSSEFTDKDEKTLNSSSSEQYEMICDICGCKSTTSCEYCGKRNYCSEYHKKGDWNWIHKEQCGTDVKSKKKMPRNPFLLPEYEIESDIEYLPPEKPEKSEKEKMQEYQLFMKSEKAPKEMQDMPLDDLDAVMKRNDKAFNKFRKRIEHNPDQILRFQRGGSPLLVSSECVPSEADIPLCQCGSKRVFEFQVMSPILWYLSLDSVAESPDWGTLLIYTCSKSCAAGTSAYVKEFLWKQDFSDNQ